MTELCEHLQPVARWITEQGIELETTITDYPTGIKFGVWFRAFGQGEKRWVDFDRLQAEVTLAPCLKPWAFRKHDPHYPPTQGLTCTEHQHQVVWPLEVRLCEHLRPLFERMMARHKELSATRLGYGIPDYDVEIWLGFRDQFHILRDDFIQGIMDGVELPDCVHRWQDEHCAGLHCEEHGHLLKFPWGSRGLKWRRIGF